MRALCSACGARQRPGDQCCRRCAQRIISPAMPLAQPRRTPPFRLVILFAACLAAGSVLIGHMIGAVTSISPKQGAKTIHAALQPGGSMSTPEGFQKACGKANGTFANGTMLDYNDENLSVSFRPDGTVRFGYIWTIDRDPEGTPVDEEWAMGRVHCEP